jgi:hypothetical protein
MRAVTGQEPRRWERMHAQENPEGSRGVRPM